MLNELRKDYFLERYAIMKKNSGLSIRNFYQLRRLMSDASACVFCARQANSIAEVKDAHGRSIRVIPNHYESLSTEGNPVLQTDNIYYTWSSAFGKEEIVVETPYHGEEFGDMPVDSIELCIKIYMQRMNALENVPYASYVALFKNQGIGAGSLTTHTHSQLMTFNIVPRYIMEEQMAMERFIRDHKTCPYCDMISYERNSFRRVYNTASFISICPYASESPFEVRIYPVRHVQKLTQFYEQEIKELAQLLKYIISRINGLNYPAYNIIYMNGPAGQQTDNFHFYIRIIPRLSKRGGFELITGTMINPISPEDAARYYRGELQ